VQAIVKYRDGPYYIEETPGREQPYTVRFNGEVLYFSSSFEEAYGVIRKRRAAYQGSQTYKGRQDNHSKDEAVPPKPTRSP
jgi:hypothetical protein